MQARPSVVFALAAIALPGLWLLLAGPERVLGFDSGKLGTALLVTSAWTSLLTLSQLPRGEAEAAIAPGEYKAWIGVGFMLVAIAYLLGKAHLLTGEASGDHEAQALGRNLVLLLVAWAVLSSVMSSRWQGRVQEDERDREIARQAAGWGRGALVFSIFGLAVLLTYSPDGRLQWATHLMMANMLIFALMWGALCEFAASAVYYWRDRH